MLPTNPDLGEGAVKLRDGVRDRKRNGMREEERGGKASPFAKMARVCTLPSLISSLVDMGE